MVMLHENFEKLEAIYLSNVFLNITALNQLLCYWQTKMASTNDNISRYFAAQVTNLVLLLTASVCCASQRQKYFILHSCSCGVC